jgi:sirohydrochlorin ferrochelatase
VVGEVAIGWAGLDAVGSGPLEAHTLIPDPRIDDRGEDEADDVEVALDEGEAGDGGGRESHREGQILRRRLYTFFDGTLSRTTLRSERNVSEGAKTLSEHANFILDLHVLLVFQIP